MFQNLACVYTVVSLRPYQLYEISNTLVCATSKGSNTPAHTRRLINTHTRTHTPLQRIMQTDRHIDRHTHLCREHTPDRQTHTHTHTPLQRIMQTDRHTHRQTHTHLCREPYTRQTDRHTHTHTHAHRHAHTLMQRTMQPDRQTYTHTREGTAVVGSIFSWKA